MSSCSGKAGTGSPTFCYWVQGQRCDPGCGVDTWSSWAVCSWSSHLMQHPLPFAVLQTSALSAISLFTRTRGS